MCHEETKYIHILAQRLPKHVSSQSLSSIIPYEEQMRKKKPP